MSYDLTTALSLKAFMTSSTLLIAPSLCLDPYLHPISHLDAKLSLGPCLDGGFIRTVNLLRKELRIPRDDGTIDYEIMHPVQHPTLVGITWPHKLSLTTIH